METTSTFRRRSSEEKPFDFYAYISFFSSDGIFGTTIPSESTNIYIPIQISDLSGRKVVSDSFLAHGQLMRAENTTSVLVVGLTGGKAENTVMYRRSSKENHVDFQTKMSSISSDVIFQKTIPSECTNVYIPQKRRCKQGSDPSDCKVVSASFLAHGQLMRAENTTSVLLVGLTGSKAQNIEMYHRRSSKENYLDFRTNISSISAAVCIFGRTLECPITFVRQKGKHKQGSFLSKSEAISASFRSRKRPRRALNTSFVLPVGLMERKKSAENTKTTGTHRRSSIKKKSADFHTKISSVTSDGISKERVPRRKYEKRSSQLLESQRICKATSVLRQPLSDALLDHCLRNIWRESSEEKRNQCAYMNSYWFLLYIKEHSRKSALSSIKKADLFSKRYVFVPILLWSHWSLLILCHLGESLEPTTTTPSPCMLLLDSLHSHRSPPKLERIIRSLISDIYETEDRPEDKNMVQNIPYLVPEVPQQRNGKECGIFVLYYISLFLEKAPQSFSITSGYPYFMTEDWFTEEALEKFYDRLESLGIESSDSEEADESSDIEEADIEFLGRHRIEPSNSEGGVELLGTQRNERSDSEADAELLWIRKKF